MDSCERRGYLEGDFRLFHLADETEDAIGYHYHEFDKIILFIRGDVEYVIEGKAYRLEPYDIVLVSHHDIHQPRISSSVPYERIVVYLSPSFISSYTSPDWDLNTCFSRARKLQSHVMRIHNLKNSRMFRVMENLEEASRTSGYAQEFYCRLLFLEFMVHLNRAALGSHVEYVKTQPRSQKVLEIMEYLHENLTADLTIDGLSEHFFISKYHMMRLFRQETGYTIGDYISEKRLLLARETLSRGVPLTKVAFDCGFKNYSAFLRAYKKAFHTTPAADQRSGIS